MCSFNLQARGAEKLTRCGGGHTEPSPVSRGVGCIQNGKSREGTIRFKGGCQGCVCGSGLFEL